MAEQKEPQKEQPKKAKGKSGEGKCADKKAAQPAKEEGKPRANVKGRPFAAAL